MRVVVVGGGLAGLFTTSELAARGVNDVVVVDAAAKPGGVARTIERNGFALEPAAGSFNLPHPHLGPILERAGVESRPAKHVSKRYLYIEGRLIALPASPRALLAPVAGIRSKLRALMEPLVGVNPAESDESLADFSSRRFGEEGGELISWLMAAGVFAGDPERLSAEGSFPMLPLLEREYGSVVRGAIKRRRRSSDQERPRAHLPVERMRGLIDSIAASLGDRSRTGFAVDAISRDGSGWVVEGPEQIAADVVVLAVPPGVAGSLLTGEIGETLKRGVAAPVAVVGLGGAGPSPLPEGFGALVGPGEGMATRGILFESSYAPSCVPDGSWLAKVIIGGAGVAPIVAWDDERLRTAATAETEAILGTSLNPDFVEVVIHRPGIPQYEIDHRRWLAEIDDMLRSRPGLFLTGWGYRGVGVAHLATDAVRVADAIATRS